ncbi:MAG TPA: MFS transporter [Stellaceae bacterium]|jgi:MFS family permease|nr:MFS transporter [Stellaceae bacterium]
MAEAASPAAPRKIHYGWIVVVVSFIAMLVAAGTRATPSVLIVPWENEFGWSPATISFAIAVQLMIYGLIGPFSAGFIDRFGLRRTMVGGLGMMAAGMVLLTFVSAAWQLQPILGLFLGLSTGALAMVMAAMVSSRWFVERRGLVMGLLSGSSAAGQLIFLPSFAQLVVHLGWRPAVLIGAAVLLAVIPIVWLFMRDTPAEIGARPFGLPLDAPDPPPLVRANPFTAAFAALGIAAGRRDFWLLSGSFFVCGASTIGLIGTHFIPACQDHGIPETAAAGILGAMGVCNVIGTTAAGWLSDRFDNRFLLCWFYASRGASLIFLPYALDMAGAWGLVVFGLFYGLDWIATVPPTVKLTTAVFGQQQTAVVYGWIMVMHQVGSAFAAYGTGLLRTLSGDYTDAFWTSGGLCMVAAILVLRIGRTKTPSAARPVLAGAEA